MPTTSGHTKAIRAGRVIGTHVKDLTGKRIGEVADVMLDKESNEILFAVVGFADYLGDAGKYHPIPWPALEFDEDANAYVMSYTRDLLQGAPAGSIEELKRDDGLEFRERSHAYYKVPLEGE